LVEVAAITAHENRPPLLATWTYGQGRTAVWTTDAGQRWATPWTDWENYDKLFTQLVRWSLRPSQGDRDFSLVTQVQNDRVQVIVQTLDGGESQTGDLNLTGSVVDAAGSPLPLTLVQSAPGRYVGEFQAPQAGNYFVSVKPGAGRGLLRAGVNVPYSAEFQVRGTNDALLRSLAALTPRHGQAGQMIELPANLTADTKLAGDAFRRDLPPALSSQSIWHWMLVLLVVVFWGDICARRVMLDGSWFAPVVQRYQAWRVRRRGETASSPVLTRLQSRKAAATAAHDNRAGALRFEPEVETAPTEPLAVTTVVSTTNTPAPEPAPPAPGEYTNRLLRAKRDTQRKSRE
ncbi:MAG TPA: glutamine amidotransferase, partial [Pirellulaceae bacterium]|nr:glutamine amidotransferase [Pirellulaceae bacterium]